jgi:ketosteroid isomerase-like protein
MRTKKAAHLGVIVLATVCFMAASSTTSANDESDVKQAATNFYAALNTMFTGDVAPMLETWSHAADVIYMGPNGGMKVGWAQVQPTWEAQAAMKLGGKVEPSDMHIVLGDDLAITQNYEKGSNTINGKLTTVSIRATNVFRKENGVWKMIGHHTDLIPALEQ